MGSLFHAYWKIHMFALPEVQITSCQDSIIKGESNPENSLLGKKISNLKYHLK